MKTRILKLELMALLTTSLLMVAGCDVSSAGTTNTGTASDPLTLQPAPNVAQMPAETNSAPANDQAIAEAAKTPPPSLQISPGLADVVRLIQADVETRLVLSFISNSPASFNIGAEQMNYLNDLGTPGEISLAMIHHDYALGGIANPSAGFQPATVPSAVSTEISENDVSEAVQPAPAAQETVVVVNEPAPVTVNYFYDTLTPYGTWVELDGYGRCWQPTIVFSQPGWRPYCDNGHWVYSNRGWYWVSGYSWNMAFHYGRWFNHPQRGWCWVPDTTWSPAWVNWRESEGYCGWAPLPPRTGWVAGIGLTFGGNAVSVGFDFGLVPSCYTFVPRSHFRDRRPYRHALPTRQVTQIINQTTVVNNYGGGQNNHIHNDGIAPETVRVNPPGHAPTGANSGHGGPGRNFGSPAHLPPGQSAPTASAPGVGQNNFHPVRQTQPQQAGMPSAQASPSPTPPVVPETVRSIPPGGQTPAGANSGHGGPGRNFGLPAHLPPGQAAPMNPVTPVLTAPQNHFPPVRQTSPQQVIAPSTTANINGNNHSSPLTGNGGTTRGNHFNSTPPAQANPVPVAAVTPMPAVENNPVPVRLPPIRMGGDTSPHKQESGGRHIETAPPITTRAVPVAPVSSAVHAVPSVQMQQQSVPVQQSGRTTRDATHRNHSNQSDDR